MNKKYEIILTLKGLFHDAKNVKSKKLIGSGYTAVHANYRGIYSI